jgi:hypothetical protein
LAAEQRSPTELQRRASLHWDAYREQLVAHPDAVELPVEPIQDGLVRVAEPDADVVGFAAMLEPPAARANSTACSSSRHTWASAPDVRSSRTRCELRANAGRRGSKSSRIPRRSRSTTSRLHPR